MGLTTSKRLPDSIDDDDLIEIITVNENKDVSIDEDEGKGQVLTAYLIREGLKYATSFETTFSSS